MEATLWRASSKVLCKVVPSVLVDHPDRHVQFVSSDDPRRSQMARIQKLRAIGFSIAGALALAAVAAPLAQAGVEAQHNETLVVV